MAHSKVTDNRPLSPHLQVYRMSISMLMSGLHRATGAALYIGTLLLAWWLIALAQGPKYFNFVNDIYGSWFGRLVLFGYTWALMHHLIGGIRHFIWDTGRGFDLRTVSVLSWLTIVGSLISTVLIWLVAMIGLR